MGAMKEAVTSRLKEAHTDLLALSLPRGQPGERSALTLLALLAVRPETPWNPARNLLMDTCGIA